MKNDSNIHILKLNYSDGITKYTLASDETIPCPEILMHYFDSEEELLVTAGIAGIVCNTFTECRKIQKPFSIEDIYPQAVIF